MLTHSVVSDSAVPWTTALQAPLWTRVGLSGVKDAEMGSSDGDDAVPLPEEAPMLREALLAHVGFPRQELELVAILQGIFPTQALNLLLLPWQEASLPLHQKPSIGLFM